MRWRGVGGIAKVSSTAGAQLASVRPSRVKESKPGPPPVPLGGAGGDAPAVAAAVPTTTAAARRHMIRGFMVGMRSAREASGNVVVVGEEGDGFVNGVSAQRGGTGWGRGGQRDVAKAGGWVG